MKRIYTATLIATITTNFAMADLRDLVDEQVLLQIAEETSGEAAKKNLDAITLQHRMRASKQFDMATRHIPGGRQDDARHAEVAARLGRALRRAVGTGVDRW
jgi:hypothetical protein